MDEAKWPSVDWSKLPALRAQLKDLSASEFQAQCEEVERLHLERIAQGGERRTMSAQTEVFHAPDAPWIMQEWDDEELASALLQSQISYVSEQVNREQHIVEATGAGILQLRWMMWISILLCKIRTERIGL